MLEYVRGAGLPALVGLLSALRVSVLAFAGRAAEAERAWRLEELPEASEGCLDLSGPDLAGNGGAVLRPPGPADRGRAVR